MAAWFTWKTVQQVIRIIGFALAGIAIGMGWIDQDTFLKLIGGGGFAAFFSWWAFFNTTIEKKKK